jgi:hypothetical protein
MYHLGMLNNAIATIGILIDILDMHTREIKKKKNEYEQKDIKADDSH